jgi:hypothetical protein
VFNSVPSLNQEVLNRFTPALTLKSTPPTPSSDIFVPSARIVFL